MKMKSFLIRVRVSLSVNGTRFRRLDESSLKTVYADGIGWRHRARERANSCFRWHRSDKKWNGSAIKAMGRETVEFRQVRESGIYNGLARAIFSEPKY